MEINLTDSELQNVKLMYLSEKEAAEKLFVAKSTIRRHRYNIFRKLLTHTCGETILKALIMGLVKIEDYREIYYGNE